MALLKEKRSRRLSAFRQAPSQKILKKVLKEDEKKSHWRFGIPLIALSVILPFFLSEYLLSIIIKVELTIIVVAGLNLLMGYTGQFSLGHTAFVAIGAYSTALAANHWGLPCLLSLLFGAAVTGLAGLLVGLPALRIKGLYLAIATMGFSFIVMEFVEQWEAVTGGGGGLTVVPAKIFGLTFETDFTYYYLALFFTVAMVIMAKNLAVSAIGRAFIAVRDSEEAAQANGINVTRTKVLAFILSAFYAGTAGGLLAFYDRFISPDNFTLAHSIEYVVMVVVGGMTSIYGSVIGALFIAFLPHLIVMIKDTLPPFLDILFSTSPAVSQGATKLLGQPDFRYLIYGLIMLFFIVYEPTGIYGIWLRTKFYLKIFPFNRRKENFKGKRALLYRSHR